MSENANFKALREVIARVALNFRAKSASTQYSSGHALQPSDINRLADEMTYAVAAKLAELVEQVRADEAEEHHADNLRRH